VQEDTAKTGACFAGEIKKKKQKPTKTNKQNNKARYGSRQN